MTASFRYSKTRQNGLFFVSYLPFVHSKCKRSSLRSQKFFCTFWLLICLHAYQTAKSMMSCQSARISLCFSSKLLTNIYEYVIFSTCQQACRKTLRRGRTTLISDYIFCIIAVTLPLSGSLCFECSRANQTQKLRFFITLHNVVKKNVSFPLNLNLHFNFGHLFFNTFDSLHKSFFNEIGILKYFTLIKSAL